ncbi:MAG: nucleotide exchange factor GrpE [Acidimicrobiia bacterium]
MTEREPQATPPPSGRGQGGGRPEAEPIDVDLPDDPEEPIQLLLEELATAREQAASHLEDLQRVVAEFDNFRKRRLREESQHVERASQRVVAGLLPLLDSFDLALAHEATSPTEKKLLDGMERTYRLLMEVLGREGLSPILALGEPFDPELHEAAATAEEPGEGPLVVTEELRRGYHLGERVIRPSLVTVGPDPLPDPPPKGEGETDRSARGDGGDG